MRAATVHNAIGSLAALYTEMIGELLAENEQLRKQVEQLGQQLKRRVQEGDDMKGRDDG